MRAVYHLFVQSLLKKMMGDTNPVTLWFSGTFKGSFSKPAGVEFYLGACAKFMDGEYVLEPSHDRTYNTWQNWGASNVLIQIPDEVQSISEGDKVDFMFTMHCV